MPDRDNDTPSHEASRRDEAEPLLEPEVDDGELTSLVPQDPLGRYMAELRQFPMLRPEEEHALAIKVKEHDDTDAAYRLITSHLRLVVRMAMDFKRSWLNLLDLIQEGNVGLVLAVKKFDPYRGIRLSTYAAWWIRAYIIKFLIANWSLVKVGTTNARRRLLFNLTREKERLEEKGIQPHSKLLAERLDVTEQDVIEVERSIGQRDSSLDTPQQAGSQLTLSDRLVAPEQPADELVIEKQHREIVKAKLDEFAAKQPERERVIMTERLLADRPATLQVLADRFGMTREGVRQAEKRLMRDLKSFMSAALKEHAHLDFELEVPDGGGQRESY